MKTTLASAIALILASPVASADIIVSGNTISWPASDDWYQVQRANTYEHICEGRTPCDVEPGQYIVTNHTTGERWESVWVALTNDESIPVKVSGNTISWPDNGWYQVQKADDYTIMCGGGTSCTVPNGVYNVRNHTTMDFYRNVVVTGATGAGLGTLNTSEEFFAAVKESLINNQVNNSIRFEVGFDIALADADGLNIAVPAAAPGASADSAVDAGGEAIRDVTSTNVQEVGVDEQDRVKINASGTQMFVLSNEYNFYPWDTVIAIEPPPEVEFEEEQRIDIEVAVMDEAIDIEVAVMDEEIEVEEPIIDEVEIAPIDEPLLATSLPYIPQQPKTTLRILALDAETPDATSINEISIDLNGRDAEGFYLYESEGTSSAIVTASGGGYWGDWRRPEAFAGRQSIIAKVDVTNAENATQTDTFTLDGQIISSRRIGDSLFFASRFSPSIPGLEPWGLSAEELTKIVDATDLTELMPEFSRNGSDERTSLVDSSSCFVAASAKKRTYNSPSIITLGVIDLATMKLSDSECFLGATETLYATPNSVFLATTQYEYSEGPITVDGALVDTDSVIFPPQINWFDPRQATDIHQFDISSDQLSYSGSGSVKGHLGWNALQKPFRMSEKDGYLRVATMNDQQGSGNSPILLSILSTEGKGPLKTVSRLPNKQRPEHIGKPGERLYASRFIGDRGYLVTFRQTDPLYVIEMEDPTQPFIAGELEIEGYSDYLHPVDENLLLGIGKDAVAADDGFGDGRGAWVQGIKLALFDVSDPTSPKEVKSLLLGERGSNSVALGNHRAITIQPANDLHPLRVGFGADISGNAAPLESPSPLDARQYIPWSYTGFHGYDVTAGANANIIPRGALIIDKNNGVDRYDFPDYGDDRAVMVNDAVFYVHGSNVYPALWDNLPNTPEPR